MNYVALAVGIDDSLFCALQAQLTPCGLSFEAAPTVREANRRLIRKTFHLLIVDEALISPDVWEIVRRNRQYRHRPTTIAYAYLHSLQLSV